MPDAERSRKSAGALLRSIFLFEIEMKLRRTDAAGAVAVAELAAMEPDEKRADEAEFNAEAEHGRDQFRNLRIRATMTPWMSNSVTGRRSGKRGFSAFR